MNTEFHPVYIKPIYQISTFYLIVFTINITHSREPQQKLIIDCGFRQSLGLWFRIPDAAVSTHVGRFIFA